MYRNPKYRTSHNSWNLIGHSSENEPSHHQQTLQQPHQGFWDKPSGTLDFDGGGRLGQYVITMNTQLFNNTEKVGEAAVSSSGCGWGQGFCRTRTVGCNEEMEYCFTHHLHQEPENQPEYLTAQIGKRKKTHLLLLRIFPRRQRKIAAVAHYPLPRGYFPTNNETILIKRIIKPWIFKMWKHFIFASVAKQHTFAMIQSESLINFLSRIEGI